MRSAVCIAVPDGASIFWSWWSSMTSAVSKYGAASSAKRTISTAPMAKFGSDHRVGLGRLEPRRGSSSMSAALEPGGADDRVHAVVGAPREVVAGGVDHGEVDRDLGAGVGERVGAGATSAGRAVDAELAQVDARVMRVDGGDELELGVVEHRLAHRGAHAPACAEHTDSDHAVTTGTRRASEIDSARDPTTASVRSPSPSTRSITRPTSSAVTASTCATTRRASDLAHA